MQGQQEMFDEKIRELKDQINFMREQAIEANKKFTALEIAKDKDYENQIENLKKQVASYEQRQEKDQTLKNILSLLSKSDQKQILSPNQQITASDIGEIKRNLIEIKALVQ